MSAEYTIETFIGEVKGILAQDGPTEQGLQRIAESMRVLAQHPELAGEEPAGNIHTGSQSRPLYQDDSGLILVRAMFGPEQMTPIHSHGSWGVIGVYKGRDQYQTWRRLDDGTGAGEAQVELIEERILEPGEAVILPPPPQDIHAQRGHDGKPTFEYVLFGANTMVLPRLYFDPHADTAQEVLPGQR